jgi:hypothetical protein
VKGVLGVVGKPLSESDLIECIYFTMLRAKGVEDIEFRVDFAAGNSNEKFTKTGVWKEKSVV